MCVRERPPSSSRRNTRVGGYIFTHLSLNGDVESECLCHCATLDVSAVNYSTVEKYRNNGRVSRKTKTAGPLSAREI